MSIYVVGGTVVDLIFPRLPHLPTWPEHSEFTTENLALVSEPPIITLGGNGAKAAYVAARCGARVTLHTSIGSDSFGSLAMRWLKDARCRLEIAGPSSSTAVNVTAANIRQQRATFFYPGGPIPMPSPPRGIRSVLVCGWPHPRLDTIATEFAALRQRRVFTALDAGPILDLPWTLEVLRPVLASLDLFLTNEYELCRICGEERLSDAIPKIRRDFAGHLVVKRGARGATYVPSGSSKPVTIPGKRARAVSTIGAGDSFNGALLAALSRRASFPVAIRSACDTAAAIISSGHGVLATPAGAFAH